jgi:hypothetical protein
MVDVAQRDNFRREMGPSSLCPEVGTTWPSWLCRAASKPIQSHDIVLGRAVHDICDILEVTDSMSPSVNKEFLTRFISSTRRRLERAEKVIDSSERARVPWSIACWPCRRAFRASNRLPPHGAESLLRPQRPAQGAQATAAEFAEPGLHIRQPDALVWIAAQTRG